MFTLRSMPYTAIQLLIVDVRLVSCAPAACAPPKPATVPALILVPSVTAARPDTPQPTAADRATGTPNGLRNTERSGDDYAKASSGCIQGHPSAICAIRCV